MAIARIPSNNTGLLINNKPLPIVAAHMPPFKKDIVYWGEADSGRGSSHFKDREIPSALIGRQGAAPDNDFLLVENRNGGMSPFTGGNVYQSGYICWGGVERPKDLRDAWTSFWDAPFNSDLIELSISLPSFGEWLEGERACGRLPMPRPLYIEKMKKKMKEEMSPDELTEKRFVWENFTCNLARLDDVLAVFGSEAAKDKLEKRERLRDTISALYAHREMLNRQIRSIGNGHEVLTREFMIALFMDWATIKCIMRRLASGQLPAATGIQARAREILDRMATTRRIDSGAESEARIHAARALRHHYSVSDYDNHIRRSNMILRARRLTAHLRRRELALEIEKNKIMQDELRYLEFWRHACFYLFPNGHSPAHSFRNVVNKYASRYSGLWGELRRRIDPHDRRIIRQLAHDQHVTQAPDLYDIWESDQDDIYNERMQGIWSEEVWKDLIDEGFDFKWLFSSGYEIHEGAIGYAKLHVSKDMVVPTVYGLRELVSSEEIVKQIDFSEFVCDSCRNTQDITRIHREFNCANCGKPHSFYRDRLYLFIPIWAVDTNMIATKVGDRYFVGVPIDGKKFSDPTAILVWSEYYPETEEDS